MRISGKHKRIANDDQERAGSGQRGVEHPRVGDEAQVVLAIHLEQLLRCSHGGEDDDVPLLTLDARNAGDLDTPQTLISQVVSHLLQMEAVRGNNDDIFLEGVSGAERQFGDDLADDQYLVKIEPAWGCGFPLISSFHRVEENGNISSPLLRRLTLLIGIEPGKTRESRLFLLHARDEGSLVKEIGREGKDFGMVPIILDQAQRHSGAVGKRIWRRRSR